MDKNTIHIDELVRQRLTGGEERETPGSWFRMRELLDKEMPEKKRVAGYYNWRKMMSVTAGLALLSAATVGSYNLVTTWRHGAAQTAIVGNNEEHSSGSTVISGPIAKPKQQTEKSKPANNTIPENGDVTDNISAENSTASAGRPDVRKANVHKTLTAAHISQSSKESIKSIAPVKSEVPDEKLKPAAMALNSRRTISESFIAGTVKNSSEENSFIAEDAIVPQPEILASTEKSAGLKKAETQIIPRKNANEMPALSKDVVAQSRNNSDNTGAALTAQPVLKNLSAATSDNAKQQRLPERLKDTLNSLKIVQRQIVNPLTRVSKITLDTISMGRLAVDKIIPARQDISQTEGLMAANTPVATAAASETSAAELVPLSNFKVQSRKTSKWNARSFQEVVRDVKFNLAQTRFYPGVSIGGNTYVLGQNNISGFHLGLFGLVTFGETWSAMAELKYVHRFNGGETLQDDYVKIMQKQNTYFQATVKHFFQFTSLQSIEMPLALRYAAGRLNLFGGPNFAYHFAVNADEQKIEPNESSYTQFNNAGKIKDAPGVSLNDFRSRFAIGGLIGASIQYSPSVQFDIRLTKNLWDNAYGLGAEQVSKHFYNAPSVQFSVFYRFSQKNRIQKAR